MSDESSLEPRRSPRQERSHVLVDAIVEAGLRILEDEGLARLTTTRVAEVAGVSVGSLYRYFPNKQAIVARVLERLVRADDQLGRDEDSVVVGLSCVAPDEMLRRIILYNVENHRRQLAVGDSFYRSHHREFSVGGSEQAHRAMGRILEAHGDRLEIRDLDIAAFLLTRGPSALTRIAVEERPDLIASDVFAQELVRLFLGYFGLPTGASETAADQGCND